MQFISVYGLPNTATFQKCVDAAEYVNAKFSDLYSITVNYETPVDFFLRRQQLIASGVTLRTGDFSNGNGAIVADASSPNAAASTSVEDSPLEALVVIAVCEKSATAVSGEDLVSLLERTTTFRLRPQPGDDGEAGTYESRALHTYSEFLRGRGNRYCWMDVRCGSTDVGRITYELYSSLAPHTCQNFWRLCRGDLGEVVTESGEKVQLWYKGTTFFRILKDAWVMGGDVSPGHGGNSGYSCYGRFFPDECLAVPHDSPGVLGMCNDGAHSSASSFYITRKRMSWMNGKYVAFGRVIDGMDVVDAIHAAEVKHNQGPKEEITIVDCGVLDVEP